MSYSEPFTPEALTGRDPSGQEVVGIAVIWPGRNGVGSFGFCLFKRQVEVAFQRAGIEAKVLAARGFCYAVAIAEVQDRQQALGVLRSLARDWEVIPSEVAWWDFDEGVWRTVIPRNAPPFARFFEATGLSMGKEQMEQDIAAANEVLAQLQHLKSENEPHDQ